MSTMQEILVASYQLAVSDRMQLAEAIWASISEDEAASELLSPAQREELARRWEHYQCSPAAALSWEEAQLEFAALRNR